MSSLTPTPAVWDEPRLSSRYEMETVATADDIDELGHVSNLVYLRWVLDAARAHSAAAGWDHAAYVKHGAVFVVRRHEIEYLASAQLGDRIRLETFIATWQAATSERRTRLLRASDGRELARARTLWAMVATDSGRPTRIAKEIVASFSEAS